MTTQHTECPRCDGTGVEPTDWAGSGNCIDCHGTGAYLNSPKHVSDIKRSWRLVAAERDMYKQQRDALAALLARIERTAFHHTEYFESYDGKTREFVGRAEVRAALAQVK